jgi:hypothetical protein
VNVYREPVSLSTTVAISGAGATVAPAGQSASPSALMPPRRQRPVGKGPLHLAQGQFKHRRAVAGQGPAAYPAAVAVLVDADHLEELGVGAGRIQGLENPDGSRRELDAVALVKVHGWAATTGNGDFLSISTAPMGARSAMWGTRDAERPSGTPGMVFASARRTGRGWGAGSGLALVR